jgi:hypothetical protein
MTEIDDAVKLAQSVLEQPRLYTDNACVLAQQLLRMVEENIRLTAKIGATAAAGLRRMAEEHAVGNALVGVDLEPDAASRPSLAALSKQNDEICQTLGLALGYPKFCDDQANFPGATEANGVCVGDHVAESITAEAAGIISKLRAAETAAFRRGWLAGRLASTLAIAALPPPEDKP